jgi:hypothetical protein
VQLEVILALQSFIIGWQRRRRGEERKDEMIEEKFTS